MIKSTSEFPFREQFASLRSLIGNTPMVEIFYTYKGKTRSIFAKCEYFNLTGSIKDRMAHYILEHAYRLGQIIPGAHIIEATSGNTGISFAAIGRVLGHKVSIIMPDWLSRERKDLLRSYGASVIPVTKEEGGFVRAIELSEAMAETDDSIFLPRQFSNQANADVHALSTGPEIWEQLRRLNIRPHAFVAGVGTGGTVMGVGKYLKSMDRSIRVHPLEPAESPTLSTGHKVGSHRIQGISDDFIPALVDLRSLDPVVNACDGDAITMAQKITAEIGLGIGISSGANVIGAMKIQNELGDDAKVVTILSDSNKKYLSTDLVVQQAVKENYISPHVQFTHYSPIARLNTNVL